jgi:hypothetical protein
MKNVKTKKAKSNKGLKIKTAIKAGKGVLDRPSGGC